MQKLNSILIAMPEYTSNKAVQAIVNTSSQALESARQESEASADRLRRDAEAQARAALSDPSIITPVKDTGDVSLLNDNPVVIMTSLSAAGADVAYETVRLSNLLTSLQNLSPKERQQVAPSLENQTETLALLVATSVERLGKLVGNSQVKDLAQQLALSTASTDPTQSRLYDDTFWQKVDSLLIQAEKSATVADQESTASLGTVPAGDILSSTLVSSSSNSSPVSSSDSIALDSPQTISTSPSNSVSSVLGPAPTIAPIDCGTSMDCFITAAENCSPASVTNTMTTNIFGAQETSTSFLTISGTSGGKCAFSIRADKIDLKFPPETPQDIVAQKQAQFKALEGQTRICAYAFSDLSPMLTRWKVGTLSSSDLTLGGCRADRSKIQIQNQSVNSS